MHTDVLGQLELHARVHHPSPSITTSFLRQLTCAHSYSAVQYRSYFWMVVFQRWASLKAAGVTVLLRYAQDSMPSVDSP